MTVVVFTAAIGPETDLVRAPRKVDAGVRYLCFSDRPCDVFPYEWIPVPESSNPRLASRRLKLLADHPALDGANATLWHDASYQLQRGVRWVRKGLQIADVLAMRHPSRKRLEDEALRLVRYGYLSEALAAAHISRYREDGYDGLGVTCGGLVARLVSPEVAAFNQAWWEEACVWGGRDQASFGYTAWRHHLRLRHLSGHFRENRYANWRVQLEEAVPA